MKILQNLALRHVGTVSFRDGKLVTHLHNTDLARSEKCIYAFVIGGQIVRIGSSKGMLCRRIRSFDGYITRALNGMKSVTPLWEAEAWRDLLIAADDEGQIWARQGWEVETPVGRINSYIAEEYALLEKFIPPLNRSRR